MRFQSETSVFNFFRRSADATTHHNRLNRYRCVIMYDYRVAQAIFSHKPFTEEDILASWAIQIYRVNLFYTFTYFFICPNKRSSMIFWSLDSRSHITSPPRSQGFSSKNNDNCFLQKVSKYATLQNLHIRLLANDLWFHV